MFRVSPGARVRGRASATGGWWFRGGGAAAPGWLRLQRATGFWGGKGCRGGNAAVRRFVRGGGAGGWPAPMGCQSFLLPSHRSSSSSRFGAPMRMGGFIQSTREPLMNSATGRGAPGIVTV